MSASLKWEGMFEFRARLRAMPADLRREAGPIVVESAEQAAADIRGAYPRWTGNLADHVVVKTIEAGPFGVSAMVRSTAPHAWLFENGSQARHYFTYKNGVKKLLGRMPAGHVMIPRLIKHRAVMVNRLIAMMERHGLKVA